MKRRFVNLFNTNVKRRGTAFLIIVLTAVITSGLTVSCTIRDDFSQKISSSHGSATSPAVMPNNNTDEITVNIKSYDPASGGITFDRVERIGKGDSDRVGYINSLGIYPGFENSYYIFNEDAVTENIELLNSTEYCICENAVPVIATKDKFADNMDYYIECGIPIQLTIEDGILTRLKEIYIP